MEEYILKRGETYTFNVYNKHFAQHIPLITTSSAGGTTTGEVSLGVTNTWQTSSGRLYTGDVTYSGSGSTLVVYTNDGSLREQYQLQKLKIVFTPVANGTYYLNDAVMADVGVKLTVQNDYGDFLNPEEPYHTLIMRRSNRIYSYSYSSDIFDTFLDTYIPASLRARFTNLPPEIEDWYNNKTFYDPQDLIILSALVSDPEDDILTYQWSFLGMRTVSGLYFPYTVSGVDMTPTLYNSTSITCSGVLPTPPVETLFRFQLQVADTDNIVSGINYVPVYSLSGQQFRFTAWSGEDFDLGDNDLPFSYYPDSGWVPEPTKPVTYIETTLTASVTTPRGLWEAVMSVPAWVNEGIVFSAMEHSESTTNYQYEGVSKAMDTYSGLSADAIIGSGGPTRALTQHSFELSYTTSVV